MEAKSNSTIQKALVELYFLRQKAIEAEHVDVRAKTTRQFHAELEPVFTQQYPSAIVQEGVLTFERCSMPKDALINYLTTVKQMHWVVCGRLALKEIVSLLERTPDFNPTPDDTDAMTEDQVKAERLRLKEHRAVLSVCLDAVCDLAGWSRQPEDLFWAEVAAILIACMLVRPVPVALTAFLVCHIIFKNTDARLDRLLAVHPMTKPLVDAMDHVLSLKLDRQLVRKFAMKYHVRDGFKLGECKDADVKGAFPAASKIRAEVVAALAGAKEKADSVEEGKTRAALLGDAGSSSDGSDADFSPSSPASPASPRSPLSPAVPPSVPLLAAASAPASALGKRRAADAGDDGLPGVPKRARNEPAAAEVASDGKAEKKAVAVAVPAPASAPPLSFAFLSRPPQRQPATRTPARGPAGPASAHVVAATNASNGAANGIAAPKPSAPPKPAVVASAASPAGNSAPAKATLPSAAKDKGDEKKISCVDTPTMSLFKHAGAGDRTVFLQLRGVSFGIEYGAAHPLGISAAHMCVHATLRITFLANEKTLRYWYGGCRRETLCWVSSNNDPLAIPPRILFLNPRDAAKEAGSGSGQATRYLYRCCALIGTDGHSGIAPYQRHGQISSSRFVVVPGFLYPFVRCTLAAPAFSAPAPASA